MANNSFMCPLIFRLQEVLEFQQIKPPTVRVQKIPHVNNLLAHPLPHPKPNQILQQWTACGQISHQLIKVGCQIRLSNRQSYLTSLNKASVERSRLQQTFFLLMTKCQKKYKLASSCNRPAQNSPLSSVHPVSNTLSPQRTSSSWRHWPEKKTKSSFRVGSPTGRPSQFNVLPAITSSRSYWPSLREDRTTRLIWQGYKHRGTGDQKSPQPWASESAWDLVFQAEERPKSCRQFASCLWPSRLPSEEIKLRVPPKWAFIFLKKPQVKSLTTLPWMTSNVNASSPRREASFKVVSARIILLGR